MVRGLTGSSALGAPRLVHGERTAGHQRSPVRFSTARRCATPRLRPVRSSQGVGERDVGDLATTLRLGVNRALDRPVLAGASGDDPVERLALAGEVSSDQTALERNCRVDLDDMGREVEAAADGVLAPDLSSDRVAVGLGTGELVRREVVIRGLVGGQPERVRGGLRGSRRAQLGRDSDTGDGEAGGS